MTKIVCVSDTHGDHDKLGKLPSADIMIHCGDCTGGTNMRYLKEFLDWYEAQDAPCKVLIAGNHDGQFQKYPDLCKMIVREHAPSVHYLQDSGVNLCGLTIWGSPYTPTFLNWFFMRDRGDKIRRHWAMIPENIDILVTHGPPIGHLDLSNNVDPWTLEKFNDHLGCADLLDAMKRTKPMLHCYGHIHGSGGRQEVFHHPEGYKTILVNASIMDEAYIPNHKPIELEI